MAGVKTQKSAKFYEKVYNARPWYHDFSSLGVQTYFSRSGLGGTISEYSPKYLVERFFESPLNFAKSAKNVLTGQSSMWCEWAIQNQRYKEKFMLQYLAAAVNGCRQAGASNPSVLEMFCADGYYSFWMKKNLAVGKVTAIDMDKRSIQLGRIMNSVMREDIDFISMDVFDVPPNKKYDMILCAGGLYHLSDPEKLLKLCYRVAKHYMVVQTVVTLETEDKDYFVRPAPGWKHGCRFTDARLGEWLKRIGWKIVKHDRNELRANRQLSDRGSAYYLCRKP